jgi:hypothetical protein
VSGVGGQVMRGEQAAVGVPDEDHPVGTDQLPDLLEVADVTGDGVTGRVGQPAGAARAQLIVDVDIEPAGDQLPEVGGVPGQVRDSRPAVQEHHRGRAGRARAGRNTYRICDPDGSRQ